MKKLLSEVLILLSALFVLPLQISAQEKLPTIYGTMRYSEDPNFEFGIYSITPEESCIPQIYWSDPDIMGNGTAVYAGDKYYVISYMDYGGMLFGSYLICDMETKTYEYIEPEIDYSYIASDLTYDVSNNTVYACSMDASGDGTFWLSRMILETGAKEGIAPMQHMAAIAANKEGVLYGIGMDGILYNINKTTAELTEIGNTGVTPVNDQSATFDISTGILYWSAYTQDGGALYTVDTKTGAATLVSKYPNGEQFSGLFIIPEEKNGATPSSVNSFTFDFDKASLEGKVSFKMPKTDIEGNELTDSIEWNFMIDEIPEKEMNGKAAPGETVTVDVSFLNSGVYTFVVNVKNENGSATPLNQKKYIGMDTPEISENIDVKVDGKNVILTWNIKDTGVNDGYIDKSQVRYDITRMYDGNVVAEAFDGNTFTDTFDDDNMHICFYKITPYIDDLVGFTVMSENVNVGEFMQVPFKHDLTNEGDFMLYSVLDANNDKDTWVFGSYPDFSGLPECATYLWTVTDTNDDWLFTPYVYLEAGKTYEACYSLRSEFDAYAGEVSIMLGNDKTPEKMTKTLVDGHAVDYKDFTVLTTPSFEVEESGKYVLGLKVGGERSKYYIYLNGVGVHESQKTEIESEDLLPTVFVKDGIICINNELSETISICEMSGAVLMQTKDSDVRFKVESGIYIVSVGNKTMKVLVR